MKRKAVSSPKSKLKPLRGLKSNSNCWKNKTPNSNMINKTLCTEFKCSNTKSPHSRISYLPHTLSTTTTKCTSTTQCPTRNQQKRDFPNKILWAHHAAPTPKPCPTALCSSNCYWSAMNRGSSMRWRTRWRRGLARKMPRVRSGNMTNSTNTSTPKTVSARFSNTFRGSYSSGARKPFWGTRNSSTKTTGLRLAVYRGN